MEPDKKGSKPNFLKNIDFEDDPEIIADGEEKLHTALQIMSMHVDPAFSFVMYRFNRVGIRHPKLDAIIYLDKSGIPTLGVNYARFSKLSPMAQIAVIEHQVGHLMCGHLGDRLGFELREYCETTYGEKMGRQIYYMTIESIADMFVTYPGSLKDNGRPYYDVRKLGLPRWDYTLNALHRVEELLDAPKGGNGAPNPKLQSLLDQLASKMRNSSQWQKGKEPSKRDEQAKNVKQLTDDEDSGEPANGGEGSGDGEMSQEQQESLDDETGGVSTKDLIFVPNKRDAMMAEDKVREIIKQAAEQSENKSRGYLSGDAGQFIKSAEAQPAVPWYQRLNHIISSGISHERRITKKRINRRNPDFGFGRVHQNVTKICFVIDTSGSMGDTDLAHVDAELASIVQNTEDSVPVIHSDAGVAKCEEYRRGMKLQQFWGRGGTSFEPALEYIRDEMQDMPDLIVYFTDGYGGALDDDNPIIHPSLAEILWILTPTGMDEERFRDNITKQGDVIKVEEWV